jgi:prepilin-type N-terminal cleavage/methylation domain-containing protein
MKRSRINTDYPRSFQGFTLIELVIVIIILGVLAVTALSRFIDINDDAIESRVRYSAKAFKASVDLAHASAATKRGQSGLYNLSSLPRVEDPNVARGYSGVDINANGWPVGIWEDWNAVAPADTLEDPVVYGAIAIDNTLDCVQAWLGLMDSTQTIDRFAGDGDYLAAYLGTQRCQYSFQADNRYRFIYDATDGSVQYQFNP